MSAWLFLLGNIVFGCLVAKVHKKNLSGPFFPFLSLVWDGPGGPLLGFGA